MMTYPNKLLHEQVLAALVAEPRLDAGKIGIAVDDGVVTLSGTLGTFTEKWAAEDAVKSVKGVRGIANELRVELAGMHVRDDADIAKTVVEVLRWNEHLPKTIQVEVKGGYVTLNGVVDWPYEREDARNAICHLSGVRGIYDNLTVKPYQVNPDELQRKIESRFQRLAAFDAKNVTVEVEDGGNVTLSGTVGSLAERDEAESAAYAIPGTTRVYNGIRITDIGW